MKGWRLSKKFLLACAAAVVPIITAPKDHIREAIATSVGIVVAAASDSPTRRTSKF